MNWEMLSYKLIGLLADKLSHEQIVNYLYHYCNLNVGEINAFGTWECDVLDAINKKIDWSF